MFRDGRQDNLKPAPETMTSLSTQSSFTYSLRKAIDKAFCLDFCLIDLFEVDLRQFKLNLNPPPPSEIKPVHWGHQGCEEVPA